MTLHIHREMKFDKLLEDLRTSGGTASLAAARADKIIDVMAAATSSGRTADLGRLTKNGECRIRNCRKFDLGFGYRLVCIREADCVVLLYLGTHDDCDRWLERNKGLEYVIRRETVKISIAQEEPHKDLIPGEEKNPADEYEERLLSRIDDSTLRNIFSGICRK